MIQFQHEKRTHTENEEAHNTSKFKKHSLAILSVTFLFAFLVNVNVFCFALQGSNVGALHSIAPSLTAALKPLQDASEHHVDA
jgi:hypothetical protein